MNGCLSCGSNLSGAGETCDECDESICIDCITNPTRTDMELKNRDNGFLGLGVTKAYDCPNCGERVEVS
jgi:hypothetical protein